MKYFTKISVVLLLCSSIYILDLTACGFGGGFSRPSVSRPTTRPSTPSRLPSTGSRPLTPSTRLSLPTTPSRPSTRSGDVTRPSLPTTRPGGDRPNIGDRPNVGDRPGTLPSRPNFGNGNNIGNNIGGDDRNWWNSGNINIGSGNTNININRNFQNSINWSTNRRHWGYNPWWNRPSTLPWYGGSWRWGWTRPPIYRPPAFPGYYWRPGRAIAWGSCRLGSREPLLRLRLLSLSQPLSGSDHLRSVHSERDIPAAYYCRSGAGCPGEQRGCKSQAEKVDSLIGESQKAFKENNCLKALEMCDKAIAESPGDGGLHEYRALILFALSKYGEAAGVLNSVLVSGPGWDWSTMVQLYDKRETYTDQFRKLEEYTRANQDFPSAFFLLGYHYMICGYMEEAAVAFNKTVELEPADRVAGQPGRKLQGLW